MIKSKSIINKLLNLRVTKYLYNKFGCVSVLVLIASLNKLIEIYHTKELFIESF